MMYFDYQFGYVDSWGFLGSWIVCITGVSDKRSGAPTHRFTGVARFGPFWPRLRRIPTRNCGSLAAQLIWKRGGGRRGTGGFYRRVHRWNWQGNKGGRGSRRCYCGGLTGVIIGRGREMTDTRGPHVGEGKEWSGYRFGKFARWVAGCFFARPKRCPLIPFSYIFSFFFFSVFLFLLELLHYGFKLIQTSC
jgi:hypothetical protein